MPSSSHRVQLFVLMVLELFIWGAWLPVIFGYLPSLGFDSLQQSWILNAFTIGSLTAMLFSTPFVDRHFAAERFLAFSHLVGGLAMLGLVWTTEFWPFFGLMLLHSLFYVPTLSIANSVAFAHMRDPKAEFGLIRMGGTIGWVLAQWPLFFLLKDKVGPDAVAAKSLVFAVAGAASLVLAVFSWRLPHTPPRALARGGLATVTALSLLKHPSVAVLFVVTFIDAAVHQGYFIWTETFLTQRVGIEAKWAPPIMALGQIAEIGTMAILGLVLKRLGWRLTLTLGVLGHAVRFGVFATMPDHPAIIVASILLHGICYAFFFATVYIFVDEVFPKDIRATAQSMFNLLILGVGPFVGNFVWPQLGETFRAPETNAVVFDKLFLVMAGVAVAAALLLLTAFRPPKPDQLRSQP